MQKKYISQNHAICTDICMMICIKYIIKTTQFILIIQYFIEQIKKDQFTGRIKICITTIIKM